MRVMAPFQKNMLRLGHPCHKDFLLGCVAQSLMCPTTHGRLTADSGIVSLIPVRSHTLVQINHEIISMVILLPSADLFKKGCCQLQAKVYAYSTG